MPTFEHAEWALKQPATSINCYASQPTSAGTGSIAAWFRVPLPGRAPDAKIFQRLVASLCCREVVIVEDSAPRDVMRGMLEAGPKCRLVLLQTGGARTDLATGGRLSR